MSYSELDDLVSQYAGRLRYLGVKEKDIVAIHVDRSHKLVALQLAVLKIGAVFLPVDKRYPIERIERMCADCQVRILLSDSIIHEINNSPKIDMSVFETIHAEKDNSSTSNLDVCYIIYTSGSTGNPKGCMLTGKGLVNFCIHNNTLEVLEKQKKCIFACVNSASFDYFIAETLLPLTNGYTTVMFDDEQSANQEMFLHLVEQENINVLMTTPTRLKIYFEGKEESAILKQLLCVCTSGETLSEELLTLLYRKAPLAQVYNPLGPSECTVWNVGGKLNKSDGIDVHIGKPIANTQIYIVDKYMQLTPIGATGELCIAGDGVGAGYLNRPELTAERFIDNPFGKGKLYKTGDLAFWRMDGNIAYVGRNDFQVKIRGLRIELGEIENAICGIEGISQAVVVVRKNNAGRQLICAFYTGVTIDARDIRNAIGKKLPKYMLPHIFTYLDAMPLTSSGKINRKALPTIDLNNISNDNEYVAPETQIQKALCELIENVLGIDTVGITDDFFDLGGDSLKAIELVSKAHNEGIYFNLQNVFDYPSVKELCEHIENGNTQAISFSNIDFTNINKILEKNKIEYLAHLKEQPVGNILLAGATGYLGVHILADYLENDSGTAYCLVRGQNKEDSLKRLKELLEFYFDDRSLDTTRIEVICADLQKDKFGLSDIEYTLLLNEVDTVINCAASVKHYGTYSYFYEVNVDTVKRLISFCKKSDAKLIHISTLSVSGNGFDADIENQKVFSESDFYIGQPLDNVYARSKFEAEKIVLDAISDGLQANIMRMGNLTNRSCDGLFQKNHESNAFLKRIRAMIDLRCYPATLSDYMVEFTPIDESAKAIMTIARHFSSEKTIFHINNHHTISVSQMFEIFSLLGFTVHKVSGEDFNEKLKTISTQRDKSYIMEAFINDMGDAAQINYNSNIHIVNLLTIQHLETLGFKWSEIDIEYLRKYTDYFKRIGFFK